MRGGRRPQRRIDGGVRLIDPRGPAAGAHPGDVPETGSRRRWSLVTAVTGVVVVLAALGLGVVPDPPSPIEAVTDVPFAAPPRAGATIPSAAVPEPDGGARAPAPRGPAVGVFRAFVSGVGRGDANAVIGLLAEELPAIDGVGTAQWPLLPTDAGLWTDGALGREEVEGFVGYLSASRSNTALAGCESWGDGPLVVIATCRYESTGGPLAALGVVESGHLHGVIVEGRVAGMIRHTDTGRGAWQRLAEWIAGDGEPLAAPRGGVASGLVLDPVYTAASATEHRALAADMAAAERRRAPTSPVHRLRQGHQRASQGR